MGEKNRAGLERLLKLKNTCFAVNSSLYFFCKLWKWGMKTCPSNTGRMMLSDFSFPFGLRLMLWNALPHWLLPQDGVCEPGKSIQPFATSKNGIREIGVLKLQGPKSRSEHSGASIFRGAVGKMAPTSFWIENLQKNNQNSSCWRSPPPMPDSSLGGEGARVSKGKTEDATNLCEWPFQAWCVLWGTQSPCDGINAQRTCSLKRCLSRILGKSKPQKNTMTESILCSPALNTHTWTLC